MLAWQGAAFTAVQWQEVSASVDDAYCFEMMLPACECYESRGGWCGAAH